jgi:hypothetical protein
MEAAKLISIMETGRESNYKFGMNFAEHRP